MSQPKNPKYFKVSRTHPYISFTDHSYSPNWPKGPNCEGEMSPRYYKVVSQDAQNYFVKEFFLIDDGEGDTPFMKDAKSLFEAFQYYISKLNFSINDLPESLGENPEIIVAPEDEILIRMI